ncbi:MAG: hypothetical protein V2I63_06675 [Pseudomonadales bacterium]|jgi:small conductance mechanosensitive channel|nr:hypothetical protein [Pseudomonadales bacterium]
MDVHLRGDAQARIRIIGVVDALVAASRVQFPGIHVQPPSAEGRIGDVEGREIYRVKFRLWPDRGSVIEDVVCPEVRARLAELDPAYGDEDWMVSSAFEIEAREPRRRR